MFYHCEPKDAEELLKRFFQDTSVQEELQKPLKDKITPDIKMLIALFNKKATELKKLKFPQDSIENWLKKFVDNYFENTNTYLKFQNAKQDYLARLADCFDDLKFAGIAVDGQDIEKAERLPEIFVMPDVAAEKQNRLGGLLEAEYLLVEVGNRQAELLREQQQIAQFETSGGKLSARELLSQGQPKRFVLLGAPGSGKTTLMSYFAVALADKPFKQQQQLERLGLPEDTDWLPILIRIRDLARQPEEISILEYARQCAEKSMSVKKLPEGFFEYWLEDGKALILLDGLDEVAEEAKRYNIVNRIKNFLGQFDNNRAIITSRPAGYKRDFFRTEDFPHYQLQPFDDDKVEEFINRWYDSRIPDKQEAARRKDSLRKALSGQDRIKLLTRNPLLLTIVALIHRYQAVLPREPYKLYDKAVETLLTNWDAHKELSNDSVLKYIALDDLRRLMENLAFWIHTQGSTGNKEGGTLIDREELIEQLTGNIKALKQLQLHEAKAEAKRFVDFLRDRTGLLNEQGQDCYAFVHKTFQEYLCTQEIIYQADNEDDFEIIINTIQTHLHDPHWREVLLLLIAQQKPKKAAKAIEVIVNNNSEYEQWLHRDLLFAGSCLAENIKGLQIADCKLCEEILERLVELEVSSRKVSAKVFSTLCSLYETAFEAQALQLLKDKAEHIDKVRLQVYRAELGEKEEAINSFITLLRDADSSVRGSAAFALGKLGNASPVVVEQLLALLTDEDFIVRGSAAYALGKLGKRDPDFVAVIAQWIEQHQDTDYVTDGIDVLWNLLAKE